MIFFETRKEGERMKELKIYTILLISALMVACGGGGGGNSSSRVEARNVNIPINVPVIEKPLIDKVPAVPEVDKVPEVPKVDKDPVVPEVDKVPEVPKVEKVPVVPEVDKDPVVPKIDKVPEVDKKLEEDKILPVPNLKEDKNEGLSGKNVTIAVLDSDFKSEKFQDDFTKELGDRLTALEREDKKYNGSDHGLRVSSIIGGKSHGLIKDVNIVAASLGSYKDKVTNRIMDLNKREYEKILEKNPDIKIFNQSFGKGELKQFENLEHPYLYLADKVNNDWVELFNFYKENVKKGKLFIWSAGNYLPTVREDGSIGNELMKDPTLHGSLPYIINKKYKMNSRVDFRFTDKDARNLSDGWLVVVGIDPKTKKHYVPGTPPIIGHLAYAGRAKEWSISAFANALDKNDDSIGSSFAAPKVTAAAALILEKYPWMDGNNIKQTLLTTADIIDDMSQPEENVRKVSDLSDKYGWGLLNLSKALNGPAEFSEILNREMEGYHYFSANLGDTGKDSVFSNEISGYAGLIKKGKDKLILSRNNAYTGKTQIWEGALELWGNSFSEVNVGKNGELILKNNLTIAKSVENRGSLSIKEKSEPRILQNYTAYKNSITKGGVDSTLYVKGTVKIDPEARFELKREGDKYIPKNEDIVELIVSDHKIDGNFRGNEKDDLVNEKIESAENKVLAVVSRKDTEEYAKLHSNDATTLSVAKSLELAFHELDDKIKRGEGNIEELKREAALLQTTSLRLSPTNSNLDSLSGQLYASAQSLTFKQAELINKEISNRLATLGMLESSEKNYGAWMSYFYSKSKLEKEGYAKADTHLSGNQFGFDKKFNRTVLGVSFVHSNAKASFDRYSGNAKSESFGMAVYGRRTFYSDKIYVQGKISAHSIKTEVNREILNTKSSIKHKDVMLSSYLESGYQVRTGENTISPFIAIESNRLRRDAFSENSSSFALKADKKIYNQNIFKLGIREQFRFYMNEKIPTTLSAYVVKNWNLSNRSLDFDATFVSTNTAARVKGIGMAPNSTYFGLGIVTEFRPDIATYMNFDASMEKKKFANTMYTLGVRWSF